MSAKPSTKKPRPSNNPSQISTTPPPRPSTPPPNKEVISLPAPKTLPWNERKAVGTLVSGFAGLVAGLSKVVPDFQADTFTWSTALAWAGLFGSVVGSIIVWFRSRQDDANLVAEALDASDFKSMLVMLREVMLQTQRDGVRSALCREDDLLRVTMYRIDGEDGTQLMPHVGGPGGAASRKLPPKVGIVGLAVRGREPAYSKRQSKDLVAYRRQLVRDFNFSEAEAKDVREDRWSWAAVPIFERDQVVAVVYADSGDPDFFDDKKNLFGAACAGMAEYARIR